MRRIKILWTDDEIEVLKSHILFLNQKGYEVDTCSNGMDTIDLVAKNRYDIIFLDENMPGMSGLETLREIKELKPAIPVVMITKSEEENIMEAAIGSKIADYLIKPVKPSQILLSLKKNIDSNRLVTEKTTIDYREEFGKIRLLIDSASSYNDWKDIYKKIVYWDTQLEKTDDPGLRDIFYMQEQEANNEFSRFISRTYTSWFDPGNSNKPLLSPSVIPHSVFPLLEKGEKVLFILIDNLRFDQWNIFFEEISSYTRIINEELYYSILPTVTQYARNAIFAGLMPLDIEKTMPRYWVRDEDEEKKNKFEEELLAAQLKRRSVTCNWSYDKISTNVAGKKVNEKIRNILDNDFTVLVYNFVDMISHARTEVNVIRDIANDDPAYRSLTRSWFIHSPLIELIKKVEGEKIKIIITTDHGTIKVANPVKIRGDRNTSTNLRYKHGRNLDYPAKQVFEIIKPSQVHLPQSNISSRYIFAKGYDYLVYPKNYNHYANYYRNTFQHGGISMQEMIIPLITLEPVR
ncbi:MAG: PglZ domain-containing protein [Bacteroidales bacterium]|nr:PglZ domain-containing protein [Bacteroidales bacterium]